MFDNGVDGNNWLLTEFDEAYSDLNPDSAAALAQEIAAVDMSSRYGQPQFLAKGGMKTVYKVHDRLTDRTVAMARMISPDDKTIRELFLREGRINALLQHPNIVPVYDLGVDDAGEPYFVMKLLEGRTLHEVRNDVDRLSVEELEISLNVLLDKYASVCEAVAYAHSSGVMHLDLKPSNIWCGSFGETLVGDWGLARVAEESCAEQLLESELSAVSKATLFGMVKGTPGYLAPEMADKLAPVTSQADIYSLGAVLYFILTGTIPFTGQNSEEIIRQTKAGDWLLPSLRFPDRNIPEGLEAVISRAMATSQYERYQSAGELANEVRRYLAGFATKAEQAGFVRQLKLLYQRNRHICRVIAFSVLLICGLTAGSIYRINNAMNIAEFNAKVASETAGKLRREKEEKMRIAKNAVKELYRQGRGAFLAGDMGRSLKAYEEALDLDVNYDDVTYQLAGIYFYYLRFDDCLKLLKQAAAENRGVNPQQAYDLISSFYRDRTATEFRAEQLMTLAVDLHRAGVAYFGRCLRENILARKLGQQLRWQFVADLIRAVNPKQKHWNIQMAKGETGLSVNLSGNRNMQWMPGISSLPIVDLDISDTSAVYLEHSADFQLRKLNVRGTNFFDMSFLRDMPLEELHLSVKSRKGLKVLKKIRTLQRVYIPESLKDFPEIKALAPKVKVIIE